MKIMVKRVDEEPVIVEQDEVTLDDMQELVGGFIECIHVGGRIDMWINDMGKLIPLPINIVLWSDGDFLDTIHGDVFFAGSDESGELVGLSDGELVWIQNKLTNEVAAGFNNGELCIVPCWEFDPTVS